VLSSEPGIDFVITDHAMPGMTGTDLAERIRRTWPGVPVVLATDTRSFPATNWACRACRSPIPGGTGPAAGQYGQREPPPLAIPPAAAYPPGHRPRPAALPVTPARRIPRR